MTSNPLLNKVALSIVILAPIDQLGWFNASLTETPTSSSLVLSLKLPPLAVNKIRLILFISFPWSDWKIAECSLSTGNNFTPCSLTNFVIICPATTSVSLLAKAISFLDSIAWIVGNKPANPTIAFNTISTWSIVAISSKPALPKTKRICGYFSWR